MLPHNITLQKCVEIQETILTIQFFHLYKLAFFLLKNEQRCYSLYSLFFQIVKLSTIVTNIKSILCQKRTKSGKRYIYAVNHVVQLCLNLIYETNKINLN